MIQVEYTNCSGKIEKATTRKIIFLTTTATTTSILYQAQVFLIFLIFKGFRLINDSCFKNEFNKIY